MMRHGGIVLAAGASSRMGFPKALLPTNDGSPLSLRQAQLLRQAGCYRACIVLGAEADRIRRSLLSLSSCETVENPEWTLGRFGSILTGLRVAPEADGLLILPVDTVGVQCSTLRGLLACAESSRAPALRPVHHSEPGKILWLSRAVADQLLALQSERREFRLDHWIRDRAAPWPTEDAAILNNVNTPEDWRRTGWAAAEKGGG